MICEKKSKDTAFVSTPSDEQKELLAKPFGCCRFVFNHYLDKRKSTYAATGKGLSYKECSKDLTALKKQYPWLQEADATALQSALRSLDNAYQNFFRGRKQGRPVGYPRFKAKKAGHPQLSD